MQSKITKTEHEKSLMNLEQEYEQKLTEQKDRIIALREENEMLKQKLNSYTVKDESISRALVLAVEKAKELENSSKNLYELEIQRIKILYSRWEKMLQIIAKKYPSVKLITEVEDLLSEFDSSIKSTIDTAFVVNPEQDKYYVKKLLNKMNGVSSNPVVINQGTKKEQNIKLDNQTHQSILKPVSNIELNKDDKYTNIVDKFLDTNDNSEYNSAYAKKIAPILNQRIEEKIEDYINSNLEGFDLGEAIRPKETLEEIMKAFDFYPDNNN